MPIYEYQCASCGHVMEVLVRSNKAGTPSCSKCGSQKTAKKFSTFGVAMASSGPEFSGCSSCSEESACDRSSCAMGGCPM